MANFRVRDFHPEDIDAVLRLWEDTRTNGEPVYGLSEVIACCQEDYAVVAVHDERVIGAAVGRAAHAQGWIVFVATQRDWQDRGVGKTMLAALERRMVGLGLQKLSVLLPDSAVRVNAFSDQGFVAKKNLRYFERQLPIQRKEFDTLSELGGRLLPRGLWEEIGGMQAEKELLERRLVLPLANADFASQYGVIPPSAVVLFGPPGTGKTTFAKAIASRLEWSFVEVFPSRLAADAAGLAGALRQTFLKIDELEHAVVFIDEVEEIAVQRGGEPPSALQGVTNELLKIIPSFRDQPNRLLVCATNFIRALDTAFLRHGRFDYVMPIGLPDAQARASIWARYLPETVRHGIDIALLVERSDGFSPADIEYAARKASQSALEEALFSGGPHDESSGPQLTDYLGAIAETRATVSPEVAAQFLEDIDSIARL